MFFGYLSWGTCGTPIWKCLERSQKTSVGKTELKYRPSTTDGIRAGKRAGSLGTLIFKGCAKEKVQ